MTQDRIRGEGGGGKGGGSAQGRAPYEAPNTLRSRSTAYVMDLLSEGPIEGFANGLQSVFFDDVPLQNSNGTYNFQGINLVLMGGTPDQAAPGAYASVLNSQEIAVGQLITQKSGPVEKQINTATLTRVRVNIRIPALFQQDRNNGDVLEYYVAVDVHFKAADTGWVHVVGDFISGKCTSPYEKSYSFNLIGTAPWTIRVTRMSPDNDDNSAIQDDLYWSSYTEILDWPLSYPNSAYVGIAVDAELSGGSIPRRAYEIKGLKIKVPTNYDPITRAYATSGIGTTGGVWDGTFKVAWTDNPAWVFYDLLTNGRYGLGAQITPEMVDKFALYEIAKYNDQLVPNGAGGVEPRFTFNGVINSQEDAYNILQAVAATFRGMVYYGAGTITATQDRPASAVKLVTNANVIDGIFTYEGTSLRSRHTQANVLFSDPKDGYRPDIEPIQASDIGRRGLVPLEIVALGVASRTQARRLGRWALDVERNETQTVSYRAGLDHCDTRPGDIVLVADRWWQGARFGGRIAAASGSTITVDAPVVIPANQTPYLRLMLPDGSVQERQMSNGQGSHTELNVTEPFSQTPQVNAIWQVSMQEVNPRPHRVIAVAEVDLNTYEITALFHDETKYARIESNINRPPPDFSMFPTGAILAPTEITFEEFQVIKNGTLRSGMTISWKHAADARVRSYQVEVWKPTKPAFERIGDAFGNSIDVYDTVDGTGQIRVRSVDALGQYSAWTTVTGLTFLGLKWVPENVSGFASSVLSDRLQLSWSPVRQHKSCFYRIKYSPSTLAGSWSSSALLADKVESLHFEAPLRSGSYLIRAVSLAGIESAVETIISTNSEAIYALNVVETIEEHPTFDGAKVATEVVSGRLRLIPGQLTGTYIFETADLGSVGTLRATTIVDAYGVTLNDYMSSWDSMSEVTQLSGGDGTSWSAGMEYRSTNDDPLQGGWGPWAPLSMSDITARSIQFRLTLNSLDGGNTLPEVAAITAIMDVPDRFESGEDVVVPALGLTITFNNPFFATPAIAVTGQNLATGDYWAVTSQTPSGFTIRFFNAAGTGVERTADWIAKGYGSTGTWFPRVHGRAQLFAAGTMTVGNGNVKLGSAALLGGASSLTATARVGLRASAALTAAPVLSINTAKANLRATALLPQVATFKAWANTKIGKARFNGVGSFAAQSALRWRPRQALGGVGTAGVTMKIVAKPTQLLTGVATISASPRALLKASRKLDGVGAIGAYGSTNAKRYDFVSSLPGGLTYSRASKAWGFAPVAGSAPVLTEYAANTPYFEQDPTVLVNSVTNAWGDGISGGSLPTDWTEVENGTLFGTSCAAGTLPGGTPYVDITISGTPGTTGAYTISLQANTLPITNADEDAQYNIGACVLAGGTRGTSAVSVGVMEFNGATALTGNATVTTVTEVGTKPIRYSGFRTCNNVSVTNARAILRVTGHTAGVALNFTVRVSFPHLSKGTDFATFSTDYEVARKAERISGVSTYGLLGLPMWRAKTNYSLNARAEGATAGTPGTAPSFWSTTQGAGVSREILATTTYAGVPAGRVRFFGTPSGSLGSEIFRISCFGFQAPGRVAATVGQVWNASAFLGLLIGVTQTTGSYKVYFLLEEYDVNGNLLGTQEKLGYNPTFPTFRTTGGNVNFGGVRNNATFKVANSATAKISAHVIVRQEISISAIDLTISVGAPQLIQSLYPEGILLQDAGNPTQTPSCAEASLYAARAAIPYSESRGLTIAANAAPAMLLTDGEASTLWSGETVARHIASFGGAGVTHALKVLLTHNAAAGELRLTGERYASGAKFSSTLSSPGFGWESPLGVSVGGRNYSMNSVAVSFGIGSPAADRPGRAKKSANTTLEATVTPTVGLPTAANVTGDLYIGCSGGTGSQFAGWIRNLVVYDTSYPAGVTDKIPG